MDKNEDLYAFFVDSIPELTEAWYHSLNKNKKTGVYSSQDDQIIQRLKQHNYEFHLHFCELFILSEQEFKDNFSPWIKKIVQDVTYYDAPLHLIMSEFMKNRELYFIFLDTYSSQHEDITPSLEMAYQQLITKMFDIVICTIAEESHEATQLSLRTQRKTIDELSAPVISLKECDIALLPLVGTIDEKRAQIILESTLECCTRMQVKKLYIDLSGTIIVSRVVGHHLSQLIGALKMIGIEPILCGIRVEIARNATQLGFVFEGIKIKSSLSQAITIH
ncbi:STAS domain-containing protein [Priestia koreensis]|uniref:STAS domain-containing protein n=1 Tax=Priestia koreensis TaxID=284581 RepID=UPI0030174014